MFDHGALTDLVLAHLSSVDLLVGDGVKPTTECGWLSGQPGDGVFRPYAVVASGGGAPRSLTLNTDIPVWAVGFSLRSFGGSRRQLDATATQVRSAIEGLTSTRFGPDPAWKVLSTEWVSLGPVSRVDATAPPFWQVFDTVTLVAGP